MKIADTLPARQREALDRLKTRTVAEHAAAARTLGLTPRQVSLSLTPATAADLAAASVAALHEPHRPAGACDHEPCASPAAVHCTTRLTFLAPTAEPLAAWERDLLHVGRRTGSLDLPDDE